MNLNQLSNEFNNLLSQTKGIETKSVQEIITLARSLYKLAPQLQALSLDHNHPTMDCGRKCAQAILPVLVDKGRQEGVKTPTELMQLIEIMKNS